MQRVSGVLSGGVDRVTWDLDAALALTGAPAVLRALLAKRAAAAGIVDAGALAAGKAELDGIAQTPKGSDLAGKQSGTTLDAQPQKIDGAKDATSGLVFEETGLVGTGKAAANDASSVDAKDIEEAAGSAVKPTVDLFGGKNAQTPGAINVDISADIQSGIRADARQLLFKDDSVGEIVASNPFIPKEAEGNFSMMDYLPEATRVVELGGKIFINANAANPYGKLPSASDLESLGLRVVQDGPLDSRFLGQTFLRTDGCVITNLDSMKTIVLEKIK
ncbi:hypothetical protein [Pseudomonas syringae group genomosp. 3]|uniref:hypothetical protein n=1 Tax=Pseudomonas syringae group TaxID=136849 RepID=UPI0020009D21|nr:hypothetical protein [Pseudomonas syringae group genomosp. 3]